MKTILMIFLISLCLVLLLTPAAAALGRRFGLVDRPSGRKIHTRPIPRIGGVAIFLAFYGSLMAALLHSSSLIKGIDPWPTVFMLVCGSALVFLTGLADDIFGLNPMIKLGMQVIGAVLAYLGGIAIFQIRLPWAAVIHLGWLSLPATVFWFLLVTNAFNLIDGLDGLAAGICFFSSLVLAFLSIIAGKFTVAAGLAALAGACLGFLRYNFNPASIFMGDSGSYFLGFMLASLSLLGSMKSQTAVAILIPVIALGLPLMDAILAPIRRFIVGKKLFMPDKSHIHHNLLRLGFSHRRAVLTLYGATVFLGITALLLVHAENHDVALIFLAIALSLILGFRRLGYLEYLEADKVIDYLHDVTDEMGIKRDRREFLNHQIAIREAGDTDELWVQVVSAMELLRIDMAEIDFNGVSFRVPEARQYRWRSEATGEIPGDCSLGLMSLDLPLSDDRKNYGMLHLRKDSLSDPIGHYTLKRIEHLRRSIVRKLKAFEEEATAVINMASESLPNSKSSGAGGAEAAAGH